MLKTQLYKEISVSDCPLVKKGKVRDIYKAGDNLLMVATDRISAFDYILPNVIPFKGVILTQISNFWFDFVQDIIPNHIISTDVSSFPEPLRPFDASLNGRSILVKKATVFPIECVVRGYLAGSGYKEYINSQSVCGIKLPAGLDNGSKLPEPIFTPATKAEEGHDENITAQQAADIIGQDNMAFLRDVSIQIYTKAQKYALTKGIIIADTKFEFGVIDDKIVLIDEVLTPDSSRFWPVEHYKVGENPVSFDKQFVRDYLELIDWDKKPPVPELSDQIIRKTAEKYLEAYTCLTGKNDLALPEDLF